MGLSLRNIGKKIGDVLSGVERQVNPFDHGATYSNPRPTIPGRPNPVVQQLNGGGYGNAANVGTIQQARPVVKFNSGRGAVDVKTFNANNPNAVPGVGGGSPMDVIHPVLRSIPDLATLVTHKDYTPKGAVAQFAFGKEPVKTFTEREQGLQKHFQGEHGIVQHLATPLAVAGTGANIALDAATVAPLVKATVPTTKAAVQGILKDEAGSVGKKAAETAKPKVDMKTLNSKIKNVKDPARKAQLVAQKEAITKPSSVVKSTANTAPVVGMKTDSFVAKAMPIVDRLNRMGGAHVDLANTLVNKRNMAEKGFAAAKYDAPAVEHLSKPDFAAAVDHLEGTVKSTNPKIIEAASQMQTQFNKVHDLATQYGKKVGYRKNYFPHFNDIPKAGDGGYQAALDHVIKTGQAKDVGEASKLLEYTRGQRGQKKFGSFENQRVADLPNYPKTKEAYHHYLEEAHKQVADYAHLGVKDQKLNKMIQTVHEQGGDAQKARDLFNRADSRKLYDPTHEKISSALTTFQGSTKLGTSFIGNAAQQGNNIIAGGVGRTVKSAGKLVGSTSERRFVQKTGVTGEGVSRESVESRTGTFGKGFKADKNIVRRVTAPFFEPVEKTNRAVGAITGRDQARSIAGRLDKAVSKGDTAKATKLEKQLREKFNVQGPIKGKLTADQEIDAARKFVERTQFRTGAQDLPSGATSPTGRVITQFKRYPYKQTGFIGREMIKPLVKEGNPLPLVRAAGVALPAGYGVNAIRNKLRGQDTSQSSVASQVLDASQSGGLTGLETSIAKGTNPFGSKNADSYATKVEKTLGGPTVGDVLNTGKAAFTATTGKGKGGDPSKLTGLERVAVQHIPDVGPTLANKFLPYRKSDGSVAGGAPDPNKPESASQRIKQAFTSPDAQKFLKMSDAQKKDAARNDPNMRQIYSEWQGAKSAFSSMKLYNNGLDPSASAVLNRDDRLTAEGRKKVAARQNDYEYQVAAAKYANNSLDPQWTDAKDIKAQQDLAKKYVGKEFDKNTRDIYSLSKKEVEDYINSKPNGNDIADKLLKYDQALVAAGIIKSGKFKNGFGTSSGGGGGGRRRGRSSGSSGGGSSSSSYSNPYAHTISTKASGTGSKPRVAAKAPAIAKAKPRGRSKVTLRVRHSNV